MVADQEKAAIAHQHDKAMQSSLVSQLSKLLDKDPSGRRTSMEAIKELIHKELSEQNMPLFIAALLGSMDKKSKHHLHSAETSSHLAYMVALLLVDLCCDAAQKHVTLRISDVANIMKGIVSWFSLDSSSSSHSVHQACAKVVCSLAEIDPNEPPSTPTSSVGASDISETDASSSSHESSLMETICTPLISALSSKVASVTSGATTCLEALVSTPSWNLACPTLVHDLCFKASMAVQESSALSANVPQLSLLSTLAKSNPESLKSHKVGLLKKASDVLLHSQAWQHRAAAAKLMESLLSMGGPHHRSDKQGLKWTRQASEVLERCRLDKVATVRTVVGEALKTINQLGVCKLHEELETLSKHEGLSRSGSMKAAKGEVKKRRKKPYEKHSTSVLTAGMKLSSRYPSSAGTPSISWSSRDSESSSSTLESGSTIMRESHGEDKSKQAAAHQRRTSVATPPPPLSSSSWHFTPSSISLSSVTSSPTTREVKPSERGGRYPLCPTSQAQPTSLAPAQYGDHVKAKEQLPTSVVCSIISALEESKENALPWTGKGDMEASSSMHPHSGWAPSNIHYNSIAQMESLEEVMTPEVDNTGIKQAELLLFATPKSLVSCSRSAQEDAAVGAELDILSELKSDLFSGATWTVRDNPIAMTDERELNPPTCNAYPTLSLKKDDPLDSVHLDEEHNGPTDITCYEVDNGGGFAPSDSSKQTCPGEPDEILSATDGIGGRQLHPDDNHMEVSIRDHSSDDLDDHTAGRSPPLESFVAIFVVRGDHSPDYLYYCADRLLGQLSSENLQEVDGDSHLLSIEHIRDGFSHEGFVGLQHDRSINSEDSYGSPPQEVSDDNFALIKESQEGPHLSRQDVYPSSGEDDVTLQLVSVSLSKDRSGRRSRGHLGNLTCAGQQHDEESSTETVSTDGDNDDAKPIMDKSAQQKREGRQVSPCWWNKLFKWRVLLTWWRPRWHRVFALAIALPVTVVVINKLSTTGKEDRGPYLVPT